MADGASMSDAGQPQLQLGHLTAGVYVFQLDVEGQHARGRTVANVTVRPGETPRGRADVCGPSHQTLRYRSNVCNCADHHRPSPLSVLAPPLL